MRHLASFIGPIAKVVVARLAKQYTDLDRLYVEASKQIENEADRKKFLRTRPPRLTTSPASSIEEIDCLLQAGVHAVEGSGYLRDFVIAADRELLEIHLALADPVCRVGDLSLAAG